MSDQDWIAPYIDRIEELVGRFWREFTHRCEAEGCLSVSQYMVLRLLERGGPQTVSDLAEHLSMSAAGATGLVDRLARQGLVERRRDETDRRLVWVNLAPRGQESLRGARQLRRGVMREFVGSLEPDEVEQLIALYTKMNRHCLSGSDPVPGEKR